MQKILIVLSDLDMGGVTAAAINLCTELVERGHEVHVLNMGKPNPVAQEQLPPEVKQLSLVGKARYWAGGRSRMQGAPLGEKLRLGFLGLAKKVLTRKNKWLPWVWKDYRVDGSYDTVVAFRQGKPCYYFALHCVEAACRVAFVHGDVAYMGDTSPWDVYFPEFHAVACVADAVRAGFAARYPAVADKFRTVYNMVNVEDIRRKAECPVPVDYDPADVRMVTVARVSNWDKAVDRIPAACARLKERTSTPFHWYVVGDGPDMEADIRLSEELNVTDVLTFCGAMSNPYPMLKMSDFSVLTSHTEGYPVVVEESLVLHRAAVVMAYPAAEESVRNGYNGLVTRQDLDDLVDTLVRLLDNREGLLDTLRENAESTMVSNDEAYRQFLSLMLPVPEGAP